VWAVAIAVLDGAPYVYAQSVSQRVIACRIDAALLY
jgi:hypothetical protein